MQLLELQLSEDELVIGYGDYGSMEEMGGESGHRKPYTKKPVKHWLSFGP
ncbi:hypothetical protein HYE59_02045 [Aggregatibacter actinomycetemcomitans]|nr:hypothetical protein [Aggregatibacter actinomycetemcomitans]MBN6073950.1 hypothetical protein [Aggregatibacter actinomycetemcomitans]MBN6076350.1 hypothetical protein [Aggregatibacter actinomycetemcomitans]